MTVRPPFGIDGPQFAGTDVRVQAAARMTPAADGRARSGALGKPVVVAAQPTPNMSVTIPACAVEVDGPAAGIGSLTLVNDGPVTRTVTAASATNPRRDLVVIRWYGETTAVAGRKGEVEVIAGTAATTPVLPAVPANAYVLAELSVPANATSITNSNITNRLTQTTALGGITPSRNAADVAGVYVGQWRDRLDIGRPYMERWSGTAWQPGSNLWVSDTQGGPGTTTAPDPGAQPYSLQFGQGVVNVANAGGETPLNFEKAFPNGCLGVFPQVMYDTEGDQGHAVSVSVRQVLKTGFVMQFFSRTGAIYGVGFGTRVCYIAVGW